MDKIEEVKKILDQHWGEWGYTNEEQRNEIARQICQAFEPKPQYHIESDQPGESHLVEVEPKPDEGRLLKNEETCHKIKDTQYLRQRVCDALSCSTCELLGETIAKAQLAKALGWEAVFAAFKDAECQTRVERFFGEIERYSLIDPTDPTLYKSFRMEWKDWQALKKREGISTTQLEGDDTK